MATMLLSAAGSSLGGAAGGSLLGIGAATLGKAAGAVAGGLLDQQILGRGGRAIEGPRVDGLRVQSAGEGGTIPQLFGRMRIGGQMIWSANFLEHVDESRQGGKGGGPKVKSFRYTVSFAVGLCEGPINRIGRVWADGNELSLADYPHRLHLGGPSQAPDPLIDDIEAGAPAFRDLAYIVFEDMDLSLFGNRIPQMNFEVYREPRPADDNVDPAEKSPPLSQMVRGVALSPGSGEFSLETVKVRRKTGPGRTAFENVNTLSEKPDLLVGLDQLQAEAPNCDSVALIVSWFGDDLRAGECAVQPCVEIADKENDPSNWRVSGVGRGGAREVGKDEAGRPVYGGTPTDASVIRSIREMNARGLKVMFYPFILMDVATSNALIDPWTGTAPQPAFPWRGRITTRRAPGVAGSTDKTAAAAFEVASFFGAASPGDFTPKDETVDYGGPQEWSFRRFILHYAHLCAVAGGVDSFCIGSELRGLTQIRSDGSTYPAVAELKALAGEVRAILGSGVKIGYAADWSEYFGHHPQDGTGDVFFHLDPLWADPAIDFVGIDNYLPLSDWRYREGHLDADAPSVYSLAYLKGNLEGGEGYDWFYASAEARDDQIRTPISDGAHGEDWVFRPKDIRNWWASPHYDRPGGARGAAKTAWTPRSKPIWFTEIGCPAVDLGANQPNVFVDPKSSENALPHYSRGVRDDYMQRRYLQAAISYWASPANNPTSPLYPGRMIEASRIFVWTWDARPWPDYPNRREVWSDGASHRLGHWITGRLGSASLADIVAEICLSSGLTAFDVSELNGVVHGYLRDDDRMGRETLQSLMMVYAFDAVESEGLLKFRHRDRAPVLDLTAADASLASDGGALLERQRVSEGELPRSVRIGFIDSERDYETGAVEARVVSGRSTRVESVGAPVVLDEASAQEIAARYAAEATAGRESVEISCARRLAALEPGDVVSLDQQRYRVDAVEDAGPRATVLTRIEAAAYVQAPRVAAPPRAAPVFPATPVESLFLDLPLISGDETGPYIAAFADPWTGTATLYANDGDDFERIARIGAPAVMGVLTAPLPRAEPDLWSRGASLDVTLFGGGLSAKSDLAVLNGSNRAAIRTPSGEWEILQFAAAELVAPDQWRLTRLLRGQAGTETFIGDPTPAGADFVLLNSAVVEAPTPLSMRGLERRWRIGPTRKPVSHDSYVDFEAAYDAVRLRPYAPTRLRIHKDAASGDVHASWTRRTRVDGDNWAGIEAPLGETRETYRIEIGDLREEIVDAPAWTWASAAQAADGLSGPVQIAVSQLSDQFGPGPSTKVIVNV